MTAFPTYAVTESGHLVTDEPGMSLRDYFAARAPEEIPLWFEHVAAAKDHGEMPEVDAPTPPKHEAEGEAYADFIIRRNEAVAVFNAAFQAIQPLRQAWQKARDAWESHDRMARLVQWRWAYADAMLAERNRPDCDLCGKPMHEPGREHARCVKPLIAAA